MALLIPATGGAMEALFYCDDSIRDPIRRRNCTSLVGNVVTPFSYAANSLGQATGLIQKPEAKQYSYIETPRIASRDECLYRDINTGQCIGKQNQRDEERRQAFENRAALRLDNIRMRDSNIYGRKR